MSSQRIWTLALGMVGVASVCLVARPAQDVVVRAPGLATPNVAPDLSAPRGTGLVLGRVVDAASGRPIPAATVTLASGPTPPLGPNQQAPPSAMTNGAGYFLFRDLVRGSYPITVTAPAYVAGANGRVQPDGPSRPVTLDDNERITDVVIRLWRHGVVSGTVRDERSDPLVGVTVRILRRNAGGRLTNVLQTQTDDRGAYRMAGLVPGDYYVAVLASTGSVPASLAAVIRQPGSPAAADLRRDLSPAVGAMTFGSEGIRVGDSMVTTGPMSNRNLAPSVGPDGRLTGYRSTYHPAAGTLAEAEAVRIGSGEERSEVDINVRLTPMLTIAGTVVGPDGPAANIGVTLMPGSLDGVATLPGLETSLTVSGTDGQFRLLGVSPGQYRLKAVRIPRPPPMGVGNAATVINIGSGGMMAMGAGPMEPPPVSELPTLWADVPLSVGDRDMTGVTLSLATGSRLTGQVVFDGGGLPSAAEMPRIGIGLLLADDRTEQLPPPAPVNQNTRQFLTAQYPAGHYVVNVTSLPSGWTVRSAMAGGINVFERPLTLSGQDVTGVIITLTKQPITLTGEVRRGSGTGDPQALVAVFPADYRSWTDEGMSSRRFRSGVVQPDGTFEFSGLGAGEYIVAAVGAEQPVDGRNVQTIDALARVGTRVAVRDGANHAPPLTVATIR